MSYHDTFSLIYNSIQNADAHARAVGMCGALIEVPQSWFVEHNLRPVGRQVVDRQAWLVSVEEIWTLWRESEPTTRWKEVY